MNHCEHEITATGQEVLDGALEGALTVCSAGDGQPVWWSCNAIDSSGIRVTKPNTIFNAEQAGTGKYMIVARDSGVSHDFDATDVINCFIINH
jgi:hypothetical protein